MLTGKKWDDEKPNLLIHTPTWCTVLWLVSFDVASPNSIFCPNPFYSMPSSPFQFFFYLFWLSSQVLFRRLAATVDGQPIDLSRHPFRFRFFPERKGVIIIIISSFFFFAIFFFFSISYVCVMISFIDWCRVFRHLDGDTTRFPLISIRRTHLSLFEFQNPVVFNFFPLFINSIEA